MKRSIFQIAVAVAASAFPAGCTLDLTFDTGTDTSSTSTIDTWVSASDAPDVSTSAQPTVPDGPDFDHDPDVSVDETDAPVAIGTCGDGVVQRGDEICDGGASCSECSPDLGTVCFGTYDSTCVGGDDLPELVLSGTGDVRFEDIRTIGRTEPDAARYLARTIDGSLIEVEGSADGLRRADEVLLIVARSPTAPGAYAFARVKGVDGDQVELESAPLELGVLGPSDVVLVQRVPHYRTVTLSNGKTLTTRPAAFDGSRDIAGQGADIQSGVIAFRVATSLTLESGASIDVSATGLGGGRVRERGPTTPAGPTLVNASDGLPGQVGSLGSALAGGAGASDSTGGPLGGLSAEGCACANGGASTEAGRGGAGGAAPCTACPALPAAVNTVTSGAGGGAPARIDWARVSPDPPLSGLGMGVGGAQGGGGGAAGVAAAAEPSACVPPLGGEAFGDGGSPGSCTTEAAGGLDGSPGEAGGGVVWIQAASVAIGADSAIHAQGGPGGDGGDGGSSTESAGGGGGAGGDGAQGGTIVIQARNLDAAPDSIVVTGGTGGRGGDGGVGAGAVETACGPMGPGCGGLGGSATIPALAGTDAGVSSSGAGGAGGVAGPNGRAVLQVESVNGISAENSSTIGTLTDGATIVIDYPGTP